VSTSKYDFMERMGIPFDDVVTAWLEKLLASNPL
jgi:hypothetical protein